ncbi:asparaginase [Helicobacter cappadocius]|uniref:Asparaginase n=1 Tax=Helicobacter cappadocius TaxID=3063998 RepID=A0AA90PRV6_9HELI|nr:MULTISPECIES: asparaginase [unclassified Helicobacter]MDO7252903.1 asparaginase [Helicobacter sp. faydin-H75]MDP2538947.1 asparaginase [Helicobacter sp. faydin-H76]
MKPKISIGSLGGTISMTSSKSNQGIAPKLSAKDFIELLPDIEKIASIDAESLFALPSGHLKFEMLLEALRWAKKQVELGSNGVILTQGTDTLEESAFFCDLFWDKSEPLILMGAMRSPEMLGAEGIRNLYNSILSASSPNSRNRGVMVVMNDAIHVPRWMRKSHSLAVETFCSDGKTHGFVAEGRVEYFCPPLQRVVLPLPSCLCKKIFLWEQTLDVDIGVLDWVKASVDGLVISGFGAGHVSLETAQRLKEIIECMPVIIATRTTEGPTAYSTYGYIGSEIDCIKQGAMMAGYLSAKKARILLWAILNNNLGMKYFQDYLDKMIY